MKQEIQTLNKKYEDICNEYVQFFSKKQDLEFTGWIDDDTDTIATFVDQYYFNLDDIRLDINTNQKRGFILKWQDESIEHNLKSSETFFINYKSYIKGARYNDI